MGFVAAPFAVAPTDRWDAESTCPAPPDSDHNRVLGAPAMPTNYDKTGFRDAEGREEDVTEHICDVPRCPNIATRLLGCLVELRAMAAVCDVQAPEADFLIHLPPP